MHHPRIRCSQTWIRDCDALRRRSDVHRCFVDIGYRYRQSAIKSESTLISSASNDVVACRDFKVEHAAARNGDLSRRAVNRETAPSVISSSCM